MNILYYQHVNTCTTRLVNLIRKPDGIKLVDYNFVSFLDHRYLHKAITKGGMVKVSVSKVLIQGPARVGKTSVKCLILSQPYDKNNSTSTGVAERPQVAVATERPQAVGDFSMQTYGRNEEKKWVLVSDKNIVEMFANDIKSLLNDHSNQTQSDEHDSSKNENSGTHDSHIATQHHQQDFNKTHSDLSDSLLSDKNSQDGNSMKVHNETESNEWAAHNESFQDDSHVYIISPESKPNLQLMENDVIQQLSNILNEASGRSEKLTMYKDWLYFIDSGGQIQFQQILQAFIPCASVLMLVINLAQDFSSQSSAELKCKDGKEFLVSEHSLQIETLLRRLLSMVTFTKRENMTSEDSRLSSAIKQPEQLQVITIATHKDECDDDEIIARKEAQLQQIFKSVSGNLLYQNPTTGNILFEVDGRKASDPEETFDKELKNAISNISAQLCKQAFQIEVPLTWYAYEILLRHTASKSCGVLMLNNCISLGIKLGLENNEIKTALRLFFLLNSILYYPRKVTNLVFIDPHSLIEVVNELMVLVCKVRSGVDIGPGTLSRPKMANFGIISCDVFSYKEHLKTFHEISKEVISFDSKEAIDFKSDLFKIFTHLLLAVKLPNSKPPNDEYFMPALLPLTDPSNAISFESSSKSSLLFYFRNGAPVGLFCAMIVNLLTPKLNNKFMWSLDTNSTSKMYSNCIVLYSECGLLGRVHLIESSDWFEIHCESHADQPKVRVAIKDGITETTKERNIEVEWEIGFFCPCGKQPSHRAYFKHHYFELYCELSTSPYGFCIQEAKHFPPFSWISLKSNQGMRFTLSCAIHFYYFILTTDKRPQVCHLIELLEPIHSEWHLIGGKLEVDIQVIDDLNESNKVKLGEVLRKWIKTKPTPTTWFNIIDVVKGQSPDVASTIQEYLDQILGEQEHIKMQSMQYL